MKKIYTLLFAGLIAQTTFAQTTFNRVYTILQTNCVGSCHNTATHAGSLDLSGNEAAVYAALYDVTPNNSTAASAGLKLADPGSPSNSFLFKKVNQGLDSHLSLGAGEGAAEPQGSAAMSQTDREMIRQWIIFGAKDTGTYVNPQVITDFYVGQGGQPRLQPLAPPAPNEGIQVYWGPMFMMPGTEFEFDNNFYLKNAQKMDVTRMNTSENIESHHYAVYKYFPQADTAFSRGYKKVNGLIDAAALYYAADVIAQWPNSIDLQYPQGTAYEFLPNTVMNLSYHLNNYNDSIIMAEAYMNIYWTPHQQNNIPIKTAPVRYGGDQVGDLVIPNFGHDTTFVINQFDNDSAFFWNIISMQAHSHKYGKDFNVWTRNLNGTKDQQIYDGSYDPTYTFDQGVYIWDNPPYRQFSPPLQVDMRKGMIHEATYLNNSNHWVGFGLTTEDEMFVTFIVYYKSEFPSGIDDKIYHDDNLKFYPNPTNNVAYIKLDADVDLDDTHMKIFDVLGNEVADIRNINDHYFTYNMGHLENGCYIYKLMNKDEVKGTGKIVLQK